VLTGDTVLNATTTYLESSLSGGAYTLTVNSDLETRSISAAGLAVTGDTTIKSAGSSSLISTSVGGQTYDGNVTLSVDTTMSGTAAPSFTKDVAGGGFNLTIDTISVSDTSLNVTGVGSALILSVNSLSTSSFSAESIEYSGSNRIFSGNVTFTGDTTLTGSFQGNGDVQVAGNLTMDASTSFNLSSGTTSLDVTGEATLAPTIKTTGPQSYGGNITLLDNSIIKASTTTISKNLDGSGRTLFVDGGFTLEGGTLSNLSFFQAPSGGVVSLNGTIETTGIQRYAGSSFVLTGDTVLNATTTYLESNLSGGAYTLTVNSDLDTQSISAKGLVVTGNTTINSSDGSAVLATSESGQAYAGSVLLLSDAAINSTAFAVDYAHVALAGGLDTSGTAVDSTLSSDGRYALVADVNDRVADCRCNRRECPKSCQ